MTSGLRRGSPARTPSRVRFRSGRTPSSGTPGRPLSAGERRRIGLARALLRPAALVVLDEPTADLDRESALLVAEAIEQLRGRTVLLLAHTPELAARADRVVVLDRGRAELVHERTAA